MIVMQPIDRPFRFTWDFCVVWALLALATFFLMRQQTFLGPWYSYAALLILASLFETFVLYGPVLLARQVIRSEAHGRFVLRVLAFMVATAGLLLGGLLLTGNYTEHRANVLALIFTLGATVYLSWMRER